MTAQPLPALTSGDPSAWDQALYAFLVEKGNRSGSRRTVGSYSRMLWPFFADLSKTPERVRPADVLAWVHGIGKSGRTPSATTVGARIACLSSFYRFLIRMGLVISNPCDAVERPRSIQSVARGYSADEVRRLLAVVPDTVAGRRDRALLLTFILTGRRRTEVIGLTAGDISVEGEMVFYAYRGKGGKRGRRELPRPAYEALCVTLAHAGLSLAAMDKGASLWQAAAGPRGVTGSTFYARFRRYLAAAGLAPSGLHILRHSAARLLPGTPQAPAGLSGGGRGRVAARPRGDLAAGRRSRSQKRVAPCHLRAHRGRGAGVRVGSSHDCGLRPRPGTGLAGTGC